MSSKKVRALAREFGYSLRAVRLAILVGEQILDDDGDENCDGREWPCRPHRSGQAKTAAAWKSKWHGYMTRDAAVM